MRPLRKIAAFMRDATGMLRRDEFDPCCDSGTPSADPEIASRTPPMAAKPADPAPAPPAPEETGSLIRYILERYHHVHRREVPELIRLAQRVEATHHDHRDAPLGLADLLSRAFSEMEQHLQKEEQGLFPMILDGHPDLKPAIAIMRDDHDDHEKRLRQIEALTRNHTPPEDACKTWRTLYVGTRKFEDDLTAHIDLENNVLFPCFEG
jgi:regulator of cell morphogenesis and NO signaling